MHARPADLTFGGETLSSLLRDLAGFAESLGGLLGVRLGIFTPVVHAELGGVDADDAVLADAVFVEDAGDAARHLHRAQEFFPLLRAAHRGVPDRSRPD